MFFLHNGCEDVVGAVGEDGCACISKVGFTFAHISLAADTLGPCIWNPLWNPQLLRPSTLTTAVSHCRASVALRSTHNKSINVHNYSDSLLESLNFGRVAATSLRNSASCAKLPIQNLLPWDLNHFAFNFCGTKNKQNELTSVYTGGDINSNESSGIAPNQLQYQAPHAKLQWRPTTLL